MAVSNSFQAVCTCQAGGNSKKRGVETRDRGELVTQRWWGANNAELHRESRLAARESEVRGRLDAAVAGAWGIAWCRRVSALRACHEGRRQDERDKMERGDRRWKRMGRRQKKIRESRVEDQRPAGSGCYVRSCRQLLSPVSVCIGGILSAPSSHWQINERCGFEEWGWCGLPQQKWQSQVEGGV